MVKFDCDTCGKEFSVADKYAGKKARCKKCGSMLLIPSALKDDTAVLLDRMAYDEICQPASGGQKRQRARGTWGNTVVDFFHKSIALTQGALKIRIIRELCWFVPLVLILQVVLANVVLNIVVCVFVVLFRISPKQAASGLAKVGLVLLLAVGIIVTIGILLNRGNESGSTTLRNETSHRDTSQYRTSVQADPTGDFKRFAGRFMEKMHRSVNGFSTTYSLSLQETSDLYMPYNGTIEVLNSQVNLMVRFNFTGKVGQWQYVNTRGWHMILQKEWYDEWESNKVRIFHEAAKVCSKGI